MPERRKLLIIDCDLRKVGIDKKHFSPNTKIGNDFCFDEFMMYPKNFVILQNIVLNLS